MTSNTRSLRLNSKPVGCTSVTWFDSVILVLNNILTALGIRYQFSRNRLIAILMAALLVGLAGVATYTWWFKSVPVSYRWGSYVGCPASYINSGDPSWQKNPRINMKGGAKTKPFTQAKYVKACGVPKVADAKEREDFIKAGHLVRLQGEHMALYDVKEPWVNPLMFIFATRLSEQHYEAKCGKLDITGALRNWERHRRDFPDGSPHSLHPYGMGLDLRIPPPGRCREWLINTLLDIEHGGRIDFGKEGAPSHYHVSLIPGAYEAWLMEKLGITT